MVTGRDFRFPHFLHILLVPKIICVLFVENSTKAKIIFETVPKHYQLSWPWVLQYWTRLAKILYFLFKWVDVLFQTSQILKSELTLYLYIFWVMGYSYHIFMWGGGREEGAAERANLNYPGSSIAGYHLLLCRSHSMNMSLTNISSTLRVIFYRM